MTAMPKVKLRCTIPYKGGTKDWSTTMHFSGGFPSDEAHATTFLGGLCDDLVLGMRSDVTIVDGVFYEDDSSPSTWTIPVDNAGVIPASDGDASPAIIAALLVWETDARNSRGGPIYLRNFIHGTVTKTTDYDSLVDAMGEPLAGFAAQFGGDGAGYGDGVTTYHRVGPDGVSGIDGTCRAFVSRRVLARRG